jgi:hypothetical protein
MSGSKYDRSVTLICSTCGASEFEYDKDDEAAPIRYVTCDRVFLRDELLGENSEVVAAAVDELKSEVVADVSKKFRDAFRGSGWKLR